MRFRSRVLALLLLSVALLGTNASSGDARESGEREGGEQCESYGQTHQRPPYGHGVVTEQVQSEIGPALLPQLSTVQPSPSSQSASCSRS